MKTKHIFNAFCGLALLAGLTSCNDWLKDETPGKTNLDDFFTSGETAIQTVNAAYTPLAWEFNSTYFSEWFIGDIASDDALKGGQNIADMADAYDIENFKTNANNSLLLDFYRAQYQGIQRCNLAIEQVSKMDLDDTLSEELKTRLIGEAHFMRGYYYFRLVRIFGGVPYVDKNIDSSDNWHQPRASVDDIYRHIIEDFTAAESMLCNKSKYAAEDLGRATKGAAQAMLLKTYLYMHDYDNAYVWGKKFMEEQNNEYSLCANYMDNFTLAGENGQESVFEIQYMEDPTSDYGEGFGFTRGTFTTILTRSRAASLGSNAGWGFNHPTQNLYNEFEPGDPRRDLTISKPTDSEIESNSDLTYLGSYYTNNKTSLYENGAYIPLSHATRSPLNYRLIRLSDVKLMYAEAALESGKDINTAKQQLNDVRARVGMTAFPGYLGYNDNKDDLRRAIRHERRVELAMEGHRWFDLCRWGIAYEVMDKDNGSYGKTESAAARAEMASFIKGKHELFPIPAEEINLNPMDQNYGY
ncbi:MAG: RagB/SusD family nutrient uptake outer membrane protein [Candidatus Limisoma sp.]|nr:RagB/SusD family nutrient uptake outer membrane protein [Candidatus Limisoma sp.]